MRAAAIIVAAGRATRFGSPKVLIPIAGVPSIKRVVDVFQASSAIERIVVVIDGSRRARFEHALAGCEQAPPVVLVDGGERRQDSVLAGVLAASEFGLVVVHDAARPLLTVDLVAAAIAGVEHGADATVCAVPVTDTIKRVRDDRVETVDRSELWRAQTPQAFRRDVLLRNLQRAREDGVEVTDEAMLIERSGGRVTLVQGSDLNLKLTVPGDLAVMEALMSKSQQSAPAPQCRSGIGYDVHRLAADRTLVLGGVEIPAELGLEGHSDADVLIHAICDALLGACAMGDIGQHFPPTDPQYRGISSLVLLERVRNLLAGLGFEVINVDATIIAEAPKIEPYSSAMRRAIGNALGLQPDCVCVKATTNEGLGFAGRQEGIAAMAVATVQKMR
jgi:2-C-methyl-D-erythritol 4-phosphate cytidylyltransferase/2-C-methyl-D-erythritol 2,4-cyclodiphosphate synthase